VESAHARFGEGRLETCPLSGNALTAYSTPERVCRKVRSRTNKSSPPSLAEAGQKRWGWRKNPRFFRAGRFRHGKGYRGYEGSKVSSYSYDHPLQIWSLNLMPERATGDL